MNKHTPGPWITENRYKTSINAGKKHIAMVNQYKSGDIESDIWGDEHEANARLIAAAPDLLEAQTMGSQLNTPDFLDWIAARLIKVYGESPHMDFVLSLTDRAKAGRAAIAKATGESK